MSSQRGGNMKKVIIKIGKDGRIHWDFDGFIGDECFDAADAIKRLLKEKYGVDVDDEHVEVKPEAYAENRAEEKEWQGW